VARKTEYLFVINWYDAPVSVEDATDEFRQIIAKVLLYGTPK
jgi:hypothetical protein